MTALNRVRDLMLAVLAGDDSKDTVRQLERLLADHFLDTALYDELGEDLALYNPGGGPSYVSTEELRRRLAAALEELDQLTAQRSSTE